MYRSSLRRKKQPGAHELSTSPTTSARLFLIKGRRHIHVILVECITRSLNEDDAFVLDAHATIFVWFGLNANKIERGKAAKFATQYKNQERKGIPPIIYIDSDSDRLRSDFWMALNAPYPVPCETESLNDLVFERELVDTFQLYEVLKEEDGTYRINKVERRGSLRYHMVQRCSQRTYLLDCVSEVFIWIGKNSERAIRRFTEEHVDQWKTSRSSWTMYTIIYEGEESILFREKFADWPELENQSAESPNHQRRQKPFDVINMLDSVDNMSSTRRADASWHDNRAPVTVDTADDGKGSIQIWIVDNYKLHEIVEISNFGQFYASESYVISYIWEHQKKKRCMLYFWLGRTCDGVGNIT